MSRSYKNIHLKMHHVYTVGDVMALYNVCRNTLSNWVGQGLHPSAGEGVQLFRGAELARFHKARRKRTELELRHKASHVAAFLTWLLKQPGYRRLPADLADYLKLPKSVNAKTVDPAPKDYPKIEQAIIMVEGMATDTSKALRDRGIVATAFVSGLRVGALSTLRLKHVDCEAKTVLQDAREMKAKNDKTYTAYWFTGTEPFQKVLIDWIRSLKELGFGPEDALFPDIKHLAPRAFCTQARRVPIPPLKSEAAVATAFATVSDVVGESYSPHAARHSLKVLGDKLCTTDAQFKAWSLNLGHSSRMTTENNYGKMTDQECRSILGQIGKTTQLPQDDKDLCLAYHEHRLMSGTPEFVRAQQLIAQRAKKWEEQQVVEEPEES